MSAKSAPVGVSRTATKPQSRENRVTGGRAGQHTTKLSVFSQVQERSARRRTGIAFGRSASLGQPTARQALLFSRLVRPLPPWLHLALVSCWNFNTRSATVGSAERGGPGACHEKLQGLGKSTAGAYRSQRCLTPRSSGAPTAGHQARSVACFILHSPGLASHRRRPLSSNVRHRMTPALHVQIASALDATDIAEMSRALIEHGLPWTWRPERVRRAIAASDTNVAVVREQSELVAFGIMEYLEEDAHLALFAIRVRNQRQGVGSALLGWLEGSARVAGAMRIRVEARRDNLSARNFYSEHGYHETAIKSRMYSGRADGIRLEKWLRSTSAGDA